MDNDNMIVPIRFQ